MDDAGIVIVGAGMAGGVAAVTLREEGYDGSITLIGDEPGFPFGRPPLTKEYLRGEGDVWAVKPDQWYPDNRVELVRARVTRLDVEGRRVSVGAAADVPFSKLLIATGGRNRKLGVPGAELEGVHQLRTVADCDAIKADARRGARVVIVGMGFIGCEVAASLRQLGLDVTVVLDGAVPLLKVLGPEVGAAIAAIHVEAGVNLVRDDSVTGFEGTDRVERVRTKSGRTLDCDLAVVAIGIEPNVELLEGTPVSVDNGVLVDENLETSVPGLYAAGDVANHLHPVFGRIRVEHYNNTEKQPAAAARAMLGKGGAYDYIHTFWSDQYQDKLEYVGHAKEWDEVVFRGDLHGRRFVGFYLAGGTMLAAVGLNRGGDPEQDPDQELAKAGKLIAARARVDRTALADEGTDLGALLST